jgi:hypothetical protein
MNEKPILFSTPMVQAILEGRKIQTRRIIKNVWDVMPEKEEGPVFAYKFKFYKGSTTAGDPVKIKCPWEVGMILWVRETWIPPHHKINPDEMDPLCYKATNPNPEKMKWKPSIFMPKKFTRIWLEVTDVRIERIQDITEEDAKSEGIKYVYDFHPLGTCEYGRSHASKAFQDLWDSLNKKRGFGWDINPWVFVINFKRIDHDSI